MLRRSPTPLARRPCSVCGKWFQPDPRVGKRQRCCAAPTCQQARKRAQEAAWRRRNPDYFTGRRWQTVTEEGSPPASPPTVPRSPPPLDEVPWDVVKTQFKVQQVVILALVARVLARAGKRRDAPIPSRSQPDPADIPRLPGKRRLTRAP